MSNLFERVDNLLATLEKFFLVVAVMVMTLVVFFDFILRETVASGFIWAKELAAFLMIWVGFIGASLATKENKHLVVGIPEKLFPKKILPYVSLFVNIVVFGVTLLIAYLGYEYVSETKAFADTSLVLKIPLWIVQVIIPASLIVIAFRFVGVTVQILQGKVTSIGAGTKVRAPQTEEDH